jgi:hypothetical protein
MKRLGVIGCLVASLSGFIVGAILIVQGPAWWMRGLGAVLALQGCSAAYTAWEIKTGRRVYRFAEKDGL